MTLRCIRHFAIYEQRWPSRVPPHGTSPATPRAENAPVEQRHIARTGPKMSSTAHKAKNLARDEQEAEEASPKRQRTIVNQKVPDRGKVLAKFLAAYLATHPDEEEDQDEEEEHLVRNEQEEGEGRPSKRPRTRIFARNRMVPLPKPTSFAAYRDRPSKRQGLTPRKMRMAEQIVRRVAALDRNISEPVKRKRGRPRLSSARVISKTKVKIEELQVDIPVVAQPRATNGRFGKKDKSWRKSNEYTAVGSTGADDDDDLESKSPRRKRGIDTVEDFEEPPKKRSASDQNLNSGGNDVVVGPGQKVLPRPASGFRGGRLFSNPNPLRFALHAWAGPLILDESSDDDEKQPETPEDGLSSAADIAPTEELMDSVFLPSSILPRAPPLTCKPSPFVFAKNRWNATSAALNKVVNNNRRASTNSTPSDGNLRSNLRTSHASPEEEVILFTPCKNICN